MAKKKAAKKKARIYGTGTVAEIRPGKWYLRYVPKGGDRRMNKMVDAIDQREALDKLAAWRTVLDAEINPGVKVPCSFLFGLHIQDMRRRDRSPKNIKAQEQKIAKHLMDDFGKREANTVTETLLDAFVDKRLREGAKPATINRALSNLRRAFNLGYKKKYIASPLCEYAALSEKKYIRQGFIGLDDYRQIANYLPQHLRMLWCFGFFFGIRTNELLSFRWEWLVPYLQEKPMPMIKIPGDCCKNGNPHSIPIYHPEMRALIDIELTTRDASCPFLFQHHFATGTRRIKSFRKAFDTAKEAAGFPNLIFHDLRRSAVRIMLQAGLTETQAMQISGHQTNSMLKRYDVKDEKQAMEAGLALRRFFAAKAETEAEQIVAETLNGQIGHKSGHGDLEGAKPSVFAYDSKRLN